MRQINFVMIVVAGERDINYKIEGSVNYGADLKKLLLRQQRRKSMFLKSFEV